MQKNKERIIYEVIELISQKNSKANKKAKNLAMRSKIKLQNLRKEFCQKCFESFGKTTRIKSGYKIVSCRKCNKISKWKIKPQKTSINLKTQ